MESLSMFAVLPRRMSQLAIVLFALIPIVLVSFGEVGFGEKDAWCPWNGCGPGESISCVWWPTGSCGDDVCVMETCFDLSEGESTTGFYCVSLAYACIGGPWSCCW